MYQRDVDRVQEIRKCIRMLSLPGRFATVLGADTQNKKASSAPRLLFLSFVRPLASNASASDGVSPLNSSRTKLASACWVKLGGGAVRGGVREMRVYGKFAPKKFTSPDNATPSFERTRFRGRKYYDPFE